MTRSNTAARDLLLAATVGALVLFAAACGSETVASSNTSDVPASPAATPAELAHEYGSSLEDWGVAPGKLVPLEDETADPAETTDPAEVADPDDAQPASDIPAIEWQDLIPPGLSGEEISARYAERLKAVDYGTDEASALYEEMRAEYDPEAVNSELDGQTIRLSGFVAPLSYEDELITEFLLVPTFGACIHVPPPPPNQTVLVTLDTSEGLTIEDSWGPVWVEGTMTVSATTTDLASASYTIASASSGAYTNA